MQASTSFLEIRSSPCERKGMETSGALPQQGVSFGATALTGVSHLESDPPVECQDVVLAEIANKQCVLLAVADGLGSALHARYGASVAIEAVRDHGSSWAARLESEAPTRCASLLKDFIRDVRERWTEILTEGSSASERTAGLYEYACTLTVAFVYPKMIACVGVGDGFIVVGRLSETPDKVSHHLILGQERSGRYANETSTLAGRDWRERTKCSIVLDPKVGAVVVSTDGLEECLLDDRRVCVAPGVYETRTIGVHGELLNRLRHCILTEATPAGALESTLRAFPTVMDGEGKGDDVGLAMVAWR